MSRKSYLAMACIFFFAGVSSNTSAQNNAITIDSHTFGEIKARAIGPAVMSGRISSIDAVHSDPRIIYVGTASGGVWKSKNGGTTFEPIFDKHTQSIGSLRIDQAHPDTVWVGTGEHCTRNSTSVGTGLYKSIDGGENWKFVSLEDSERISAILIDPRKPNTVYVAALGHLWSANEQRGVYKTTDGGKKWERILYVDENTGCSSLAMDPQEPDILYAGMWQFRRYPDKFHSGGPGSGLYKSTDGGKNWKEIRSGLPDSALGRITVAVAPSRPNVVYAVVEAKKTALYRSDDLGENWKKMSNSFIVTSRPFYYGHLVVDPHEYNVVYKPSTSIGVSRDGGKTFASPFTRGGVHSDHHALWIDPNDTQHLLLGTDGGVYQSRDRGQTWGFFKNLPVSQFYRVSFDMVRPYNVYGGLQDNGSWSGPSSSPGGIENRDWENLGGGDGFYVFPDPADEDILYLESQGGNIIRKHRSTLEMKRIKPFPKEGEEKYRFNWNTPIAFSPTNPNRMYLGSQYLLRSDNKGDSW
ncbi:MAG: WD40/YVTN/BNR-like repeat-containing protein, partial [bacterium]